MDQPPLRPATEHGIYNTVRMSVLVAVVTVIFCFHRDWSSMEYAYLHWSQLDQKNKTKKTTYLKFIFKTLVTHNICLQSLPINLILYFLLRKCNYRTVDMRLQAAYSIVLPQNPTHPKVWKRHQMSRSWSCGYTCVLPNSLSVDLSPKWWLLTFY